MLACYPTIPDNPRADYPLPTGVVVPHMQVGAELPLFADFAARYPMIAFAHGFRGSPLSSDYIEAMTVVASYGYIVAGSILRRPTLYRSHSRQPQRRRCVIVESRQFCRTSGIASVATSAEIDLMLSDPQWSDHIDETQIGGFGASMGGETLLLLGGAELTTSLDFARTQVIVDTRLKAAVGYIPFFGEFFLPAFGQRPARARQRDPAVSCYQWYGGYDQRRSS